MQESTPFHYACVLGSHPQLSFAELEAVLAIERISYTGLQQKESIALFTTDDPIQAEQLMSRLGGTIKIIQIIDEFDEETVVDWLFEQVNTDSKFHFGFSLYSLDAPVSSNKYLRVLHTMGLEIKRALKQADISARFVSSKEITLSSVIVHKERLLKNGVEIVLFKERGRTQFGKTLAVQPFQEFSKRDYGRPQRDARSGMLPPKLARMMINIARPEPQHAILDPFCGSGTILQEALLLGYKNVIGSDISKKAIEDTRNNLEWLNVSAVPLSVHDARRLLADHVLQPRSIDRIIFEGFLGEPNPHSDKIETQIKQLNTLYSEVFQSLAKIVSGTGTIVAALPFWHTVKKEYELDIERILRNTGLQQIQSPLRYRRQHSTVGRHIIIVSHEHHAK